MGLRLDLGGGTDNTKAPGHINIDLTANADIQWDLNLGLPLFRLANWPTDYKYEDERALPTVAYSSKMIEPNVEGIRCHQVVEHLDTIIPLMNDCYEVMKPGAIMEISTPRAGTDPFWQDPTHVRGFIRRTFDYFCDDPTTADAREEYGITSKFTVVWELLEHGWNLQVHLKK